MFPVPPRLPGEALFDLPRRDRTGPSSLASWPMRIEERFPCDRDRDLVCGNPGMPFTMHGCWAGTQCQEWRFQTRQRMEMAERQVAIIAHGHQAAVCLRLRYPEGIISTSYDFRPAPVPKVPMVKIVGYLVTAILMIIALASI